MCKVYDISEDKVSEFVDYMKRTTMSRLLDEKLKICETKSKVVV
jgi:hypothetical protein